MMGADMHSNKTSSPSEILLVRNLSAMIAIPSVNPFDEAPTLHHREQEFADFLLKRFGELGLEIGQREVVPGRPNIWGRLRGNGSGPTLMLAAHMDTVGVDGYDKPFEARVEGGRVHGRGACDMKAAIACYLEVVRLLNETGGTLDGDLIIAGICDEEHLMIGSTDLGCNGPQADYGIVGEPTELKVCPAHKGQLGVIFRTFGKAVHSSVPENGVNAIEHMGAVIDAFSAYNHQLQTDSEPHPLCGTGRFSMNVIRGGDIVSAVADYCEMEVDRRYLPGETVDQIIADYHMRLEKLASSVPLRDFRSHPRRQASGG